MNTPIIWLKNIKHYDMKKTYSIRIFKDEKVLITGSNGIGKTTILQMIAGFIKPKNGQVHVQKTTIGYLHSMKYLPTHMKVMDYLHQWYKLYNVSIDPWLWMILFIDQHKKVTDLSKGQKQKLLLLMCFLGNPHIVLLDEPFDGLDETTSERLLEYIKHYEHTIIMTSHQPLKVPFTAHIQL
jgi:ABC-type multidrug transport system ATPase subunit